MKPEFPDILLETEQLLLRHFRYSDSADCFAFLSHRDTCYSDGGYEPFTTMDDEYHALIDRFLNQKGRYMIVSRSSSTVIGTVHLMPSCEEGEPVLEIGYVVSPDFRRQGYAYEAVAGLIPVLFSRFQISAVTAGAIAENTTSLALLNKLGFSFYRREPKAFRHPIHGDLDLLYYKLERP